MINVTRSSMPDFDEYCNEIKELWDSHWLTNMGAKHEELRRSLADYLGAERIDLFCNGHMALELAIRAMGLTGEVITTPFTFVSTTHAIVRNGLTPVFCDIDPVTYTIDPTKIEALITEKTSAILPVHVYGNVCNVEEIERIAKKYNLKVIYDAAHAFGVTYKGKGIASFGDAAMFSFHATKVFNTIEGGAVCFHDEAFGKRLFKLKNFGQAGADLVDEIAPNAKMNEFAAAMGICNLRHVEAEIAKRQLVCDRYAENLKDVPGIQRNAPQKDVQWNCSYFPVLFDKEKFGSSRDEVFEKLRANSIIARKYFYPLTNEMDCYRGVFAPGDTPVAKYISENVLTLPLYADLTMDQVDRICDIILK